VYFSSTQRFQINFTAGLLTRLVTPGNIELSPGGAGRMNASPTWAQGARVRGPTQVTISGLAPNRIAYHATPPEIFDMWGEPVAPFERALSVSP